MTHTLKLTSYELLKIRSLLTSDIDYLERLIGATSDVELGEMVDESRSIISTINEVLP